MVRMRVIQVRLYRLVVDEGVGERDFGSSVVYLAAARTRID